MIEFKDFKLENGLRVIHHHDESVKVTVLNILYDVGSRDEEKEKTGFAHLFEHLMFGGSTHIKSYDEQLEKVGGDNNAFTSTDITNYYLTIPTINLETGFWLESDRMLGLSFDPEVLEVQRKVVIEEFKQRYLNQPYGDAWLKLRPLAYKVHPYRWATIGKEISHIENATMEDVRDFFYHHYLPNNAILVIAGNITLDKARRLTDKWFGQIPAGKVKLRQLATEPPQTESRIEEVSGNVPADAIYKAYHMPGRFDDHYHTVDLLSDILGRSKSSRLYQSLVYDKKLFTSLNAYVTGSIDPGLLVISGKINKGYKPEECDEAINQVINEILNNGIKEEELEKVKNQAQSSWIFEEVELLNRAMNLAYFSLSGDVNNVNSEIDRIKTVNRQHMENMAGSILLAENCSTLYYRAKNEF